MSFLVSAPSIRVNAALIDDASDAAVIEKNGVTPDWGCNPI